MCAVPSGMVLGPTRRFAIVCQIASLNEFFCEVPGACIFGLFDRR